MAAVSKARPWPAGRVLLLLLPVDVVIGWLNYHATDDVQAVAAALVVAGFGFAAWRPRWAAAMVLLLWAAVPVSTLLGDVQHYNPGLAGHEPLYQTLIALIPTGLGAALGAGLRLLAAHT